MSMTVTMDDALKVDFSAICAEIGMSASTAVNIFAKTVVRERCIPFELSAQSNTEREVERAVRTCEHQVALAINAGYRDYLAGDTISLDELRNLRTQV